MAPKKYDPFDYVKERIPKYITIENVVLFFDVVGFTKNSTNIEMEKIIHKIDTVIDHLLYEHYNWNEHHFPNHFILMPTGDGLGIGFHPSMGDNYILGIVSGLYKNLIGNNGIKIRMGLAKGPNTRYLDVNETNNLFGWGVNTAYRVMEGAGENQILIHEDYAMELGKIKEFKIIDNEPINIETKHGEKLIAFKLIPA